jgi:hypothetical protein
MEEKSLNELLPSIVCNVSNRWPKHRKILEFVRGDSCLKQCPLLAGRCTRFSALLGSWDSEITHAGLPL